MSIQIKQDLRGGSLLPPLSLQSLAIGLFLQLKLNETFVTKRGSIFFFPTTRQHKQKGKRGLKSEKR